MDFSELIAPLPVDRFMSEHCGRRPIHIPADPASPRGALMSWDKLNRLLSLWTHWSADNLRLMRGGRPIAPDLYLEEVPMAEGPMRRASLAKVETFLAMGASLVANYVHTVSPEVRAVTDMLAERFAGVGNANLYCSFEGVQAFSTHYDSHEVFAVHCEGEKVWRIYANRVADPVDQQEGSEEAQRRAQAERGEVLLEVTMRPGDLLYIPRGYYHDALASSRESLHLTLSVMPASGRQFLKVLKRAALREPLFRDYLPDARSEGGEPLRAHLDQLAERIGQIVRSPAFFDAVEAMQRRQATPAQRLQLPGRPDLRSFMRTDRKARVERRDSGAVIVTADGQAAALGLFAEEAEWLLSRPLATQQELAARYPQHSQPQLEALIETLVGAGLLKEARIKS